ncbi:MAG TPA: response regulator [Flavobacteriaceae bacterium]|nr:response regulator [Flavobacteriaceae bacterium]
MIKALLIDDEPHANALLKTLLERYFSDILEVIATAPSIRDARLILSEQEVNLVFLDIQMPEENGFSLFNYFPEPSFDVIFTTAYDNFAIQAFKYSAFDYLLKPMDKESLNETLQRYLSKKTILRYQKEQIELLRSYIN